VFVHGASVRQSALLLFDAGVTDTDAARRLGLPRSTVRDWRRPRYSPKPRGDCWRCWQPTRQVILAPADYSELLGLYLGDGHISQLARTQRLRLSLDSRHVNIIAETDALLRRCFPDNRVGRVRADGGATTVLYVYNGHLSCLFPQHGPGKKHERSVALEPWQQAIVEVAPWSLLRGLIRSDGCVFVNRTGKYSYLSYCFDNLSPDIRGLFVETCQRVGVDCRPSGTSVRIYRRASVALFAEHVGTKD
jgi:hypothetical protein